jgi:signal transduction histidine kinase
VAIAIGLGVIGVIAAALSPGPLANTPWVINPLGAPPAAAVLLPMATLATLGGLVCILVAAASVPLRLRRAQGDERLQIKWIVYGTCIFAVGYALTVVVPRDWVPAVRVPYLLSVLAFVVAPGVAMLKYRLYSVDLVISRSLLYGALAVTITAIYVGVVAGVGTLAHTTGEPNLVLSLVATAIVAVLFQPARERLHRLANRLVYGRRASPYDVLAGFSRRLAHALSVDQVLPLMAETAAHGVGASRSLVRVHVPGGTDRVTGWPTEPNGESIDRVVPVLHHGELVGEIGVAKPPGDPLRATEQALLDDLAAQAGPALSNVRLTEDLRASRQRIVSAQDQERRPIERDLHDGAQQHLVVLAINARLARELLETDPSQAAPLLADIESEATEALAALRDLARGIYPPVLAERGLVAALSDHIMKAAPRTRLEVDPVTTTTRFAPELEAGVYFCCLEALQNAAKYAANATVVVSVAREPGGIAFLVIDDGPGFDASAPRTGTGLQGIADRLAALGGCMELESLPGHGTRVTGRVPSDQP